MGKFNIAIDGPSGVGKSTIANLLAQHYHMTHLDTGAMYRCVAYYFKNNKIDLNDPASVQAALDSIRIAFDQDRVYLNDEDVTQSIRFNEISMAASKVSKLEAVRKKLVLDGRDICTVVLPDAEIKIYMDASSKARAQRRYDEYVQKGIDADYETIFQDIVARDYQDTHRKNSPLKVADDAVVVDTSDLTIEEVIDKIEEIIEDTL